MALNLLHRIVFNFAIASSLNSIGAMAGVPISAVAALAGAAFMDNDKVNKHALALAVAKHDTVSAFVFQALNNNNNNNVSDVDFKQITHEMQKYNELTEFTLKFKEKTKLI